MGKWKGAPEVTTKFPVLHQLEAAGLIAPNSASECETAAKRGLKKHELARRHQNARMKMVDRVSTAPSILRVIRTTVIEPADIPMVAINTSYMGALERTGAEAKAAHENGAKQRTDTATENFASPLQRGLTTRGLQTRRLPTPSLLRRPPTTACAMTTLTPSRIPPLGLQRRTNRLPRLATMRLRR